MRLGCASDSDASDSDAACDSDAARPPAPTRMARETMAGDDWRPPLLQKAPNCKRFYRFSSSVSPTRHTTIGGRHSLQSPRVRRRRAESALRRPGARRVRAGLRRSFPSSRLSGGRRSFPSGRRSFPSSRLSCGQPPQRRPAASAAAAAASLPAAAASLPAALAAGPLRPPPLGMQPWSLGPRCSSTASFHGARARRLRRGALAASLHTRPSRRQQGRAVQTASNSIASRVLYLSSRTNSHCIRAPQGADAQWSVAMQAFGSSRATSD